MIIVDKQQNNFHSYSIVKNVENYKLKFMPHSFIALFHSFTARKISNINLCTALTVFHRFGARILMIGANHKISFMIFRLLRETFPRGT
jgi:hypothetical protein